MTKQLIGAVAFTALCLFLIVLGWHVGGIVGALLWCAGLPCAMIAVGWLLSLLINTDGWF